MSEPRQSAAADYMAHIIRNSGAENVEFKDSVIITDLGLNIDFITFKNCTFANNVVVEDNKLGRKLNFFDCEFKHSLVISRTVVDVLHLSRCKIKKVSLDSMMLNHIVCDDNVIETLNLRSQKGSKENSSFNFNDSDIEVMKIEKGTFDGFINFRNIKFKSILIDKSSLNFFLQFECCTGSDINIINSVLNGNFNLLATDNHFKNLHLESSIFNERVDIGCIIEERLYIRKSDFNEQVVANKSLSCNAVTLQNLVCKRNISFEINGNIESFTLSDSTFDVSLELSGDYDKFLPVENSLNLSLQGVIAGNVIVHKVNVWNIYLSCINLGLIYFSNLYIQLLVLEDFYNSNRLLISNLIRDEKYSTLVIYNSNIGSTEFLNVDFTCFDEVVVAKSNLTGMVLTNSSFPDRISLQTKNKIVGYKLGVEEKRYWALYYRDSYRQLKIAMEKQGNKNSMLKYKSKEMKYLWSEIPSFSDRILLAMNYLSNNHGISWLRGIVFTLSITLFFFIIYAISLGKSFYLGTNGNIDISSLVKQYVNFFTSYPKLELNPGYEKSWSSNLIVFVGRIFMSYGIFQTIVAFRKYGGK